MRVKNKIKNKTTKTKPNEFPGVFQIYVFARQMGISGDPGHNHWDGRFPAIILAAEFVYCLNFTRSYEIYGLTVTATLALTCT